MRKARRLSRFRRALSVALVASGSPLIDIASAQTWNDPNSGAWSTPANWLGGAVPTPGPSTQLTFNAAGNSSYLATNDLANPFTLNALRFNNTGSGTIGIDGNPLLFAGVKPVLYQLGAGTANVTSPIQINSTGANTDALTISGSGAGPIIFNAPISSTTVPTGTGGGAVHLASNTTLDLRGGGTLFALRSSSGTIALNGGTWNLTSTQRRNDVPVGGIDDGPWSLSIGETTGQTTRFIMNGGSLTARQGFFSIMRDTVSVATFSNGAIATFDPVIANNMGRFGINRGTGTINVLSGSQITCRLLEIARQPAFNGSYTAFVNVDGPGSRIDCSQQMVICRGENSVGGMKITNGGVASVNGNSLVASSRGDDAIPNTATLTVSGAGSRFDNTGRLEVGVGGDGSLIVSAGGQVNTGTIVIGLASFPSGGVGTALVQNGTLTTGTLIIQSGTAPSLLRVTNGGALEMNAGGAFTSTTGFTFYDQANIEIAGSGSRFRQSGAATIMIMSGGGGEGLPAGTTTFSIVDHGLMQIGSGGLFCARNPQGTVTGSVSGTGSRLTVGTFGTGSGDLVLASEESTIATLTISAGAELIVAGNSRMSLHPAARSNVQVDNATWTTAGQLQIGGSGGIGAGTATLNVLNGGGVSSGGASAVYSLATLTIGSDAIPATFMSGGTLSANGHVFYNSGTLVVGGELAVGGSVVLSDAARNANGTASNKKVLEVSSMAFTGSGFVDLNDNDAIDHNDSLSEVETFIRTGRNGGLWNGTMLVSTAAKNHPLKITGLGAISGQQFHSAHGNAALFDDRVVANSDVLIKYTFNGDADFSGKIDGADYARIDTSFNNEPGQGNIGGWINGDFDYNGKVDGADYALIDAAFNGQGSVIFSRDGAPPSVVPEPFNALIVAMSLLAMRRTRGSRSATFAQRET